MTEVLPLPNVSIAVPGNWIALDLEAAEDPRAIEAIVNQRIADGTFAEPARHDVASLLNRLVARMVDDHVLFAAALVDDTPGGTVVASVALTAARVSRPAAGATPAEDQLGVSLKRRPSATASADFQLGAEDVGVPLTTIKRSTSAPIDLPAGPAVRIDRVDSYPLSERADQEMVIVQYVIPLDDDGMVLTLTGSSPAVRAKDAVSAMFQEIAETIEIDRVLATDE
jgi:hypothetical protein